MQLKVRKVENKTKDYNYYEYQITSNENFKASDDKKPLSDLKPIMKKFDKDTIDNIIKKTGEIRQPGKQYFVDILFTNGFGSMKIDQNLEVRDTFDTSNAKSKELENKFGHVEIYAIYLKVLTELPTGKVNHRNKK